MPSIASYGFDGEKPDLIALPGRGVRINNILKTSKKNLAITVFLKKVHISLGALSLICAVLLSAFFEVQIIEVGLILATFSPHRK